MASNATSGNSKNPTKAIRTRNPLMMMSARRNPVYEFDHKMPLSVGATVSKSLAKNWELESGIIYTYLYSKYHSTNGNGSQELHYLGIPIDIIYRFARVKRASFYASAGGKVDFYLTGQQKDKGHDEGISGSGYSLYRPNWERLSHCISKRNFIWSPISHIISRIIRVYTIYGKINLSTLD